MTARRLAPVLLCFAYGLAGCSVETPAPTPLPAPEPPKAKTEAKAPTPTPPETKPDAPPGASPPALLAARKNAPEIEQTLAKANRMLESGNVGAAVPLFEEVLRSEPENLRALSALGQSAQRVAMDLGRPRSNALYLRSAEAYRKLRKLQKTLSEEDLRTLPVAFYNEACTLAMTGQTDKALASLNEAYETGFLRIDVLDTDNELDPLRRFPAFKELQARLETRHVDNLLANTAPFDFDFKLPNLDGKAVPLAELRGDVTVVDIWGTWCVFCRKELPNLMELAKRYKDKGVRVVGVNFEKEEGDKAREIVRAFVKERGIEFPCVIGDQATQERIPSFEGFPTTLFLDSTGKVRAKLSGYQSLLALETVVQRLLAEKDPKPAPAKAEEASKPAQPKPAEAGSTPKQP